MQLYNKLSAKERAVMLEEAGTERLTLSFYQYAHIGNPQLFRDHLFLTWNALEVLGRIYVAHEGINAQLSEMDIHFELIQQEPHVFLNGQDVSYEIRQPEVAGIVSIVASYKPIREKLVEAQQKMGEKGGIVMDGRDIGTVVFPDAELKIFVTASIEVRTQRRLEELRAKGEVVDQLAVEENLKSRDHQDSTRAESPLKQAADAVVLDTSALSREEQLSWALARVALLVTD